MTDERAIEASQLSQAMQSRESLTSVAYYEPKLADISRQGRLYVLAEGLPGSHAGNVASRYAVRKLINSFYTSKTADLKKRLLEVVEETNRDIFGQNAEYPNRRPMATTIAAALIHDNKLLVASVGDNQVYVVWDQDIEHLQPTEDSEPMAKLNGGVATATAVKTETTTRKKTEQAVISDSFLDRLPQGLGLTKEIKIDIFARRLFAGDIVVLCSGGLSGYLTEKEIVQAVNLHPPEQSIKHLFALAAQRGYQDSCGITVARVLTSPVGTRPSPLMTLPSAPNWSDWSASAAPRERSPSKPIFTTATQPLTAAGNGRGEWWERAQQLGLETRKRWGWQGYAVALAVLLLLCVALPWLAWSNISAAVPFLGETEPAAVSNSEAAEDTAPAAEAASPETVPAAAARSGMGFAGQTSPLATPEMVSAGPLGSPTAASANDVVMMTATPTPSPTPAPLPTITLPAGCTNRARFVRDETIPDGTQLAAGEQFEKAWVVVNAETCPFGPGYTVRFMSGDPLGAPPEIRLTEVIEPQENGEIRIPMVAPAQVGDYRSVWQLHDLNGEPFGPDLYLEIEVTPPDLTAVDPADINVVYDFIANAGEAIWSSGSTFYNVSRVDITENLPLPAPQGLVAVGIAQLRGNQVSEGNTLLTYPDQESGYIAGTYTIDTPLQPTDALAATLGFTKLSILSDDGVTFEVSFIPEGSEDEVIILSQAVEYADSPVSEIVPLTEIEPGQTGTFILRVFGRDSLSQDWAVWINARLVRP